MNAIMSKPSAVHYQEYPPLFKIDSKGSTRVWSVTASNDEIIVSHGLKDGAKIIDITKCSPKNVGRSNETTGEMQAVLESQALWIKKTVRDGYSDTVKEFDGFVQPMLARDYTKVAHQIKAKKLYVSAKLDGLRAIWIPSAQKFQSRKGTFYDVPYLEAIMKFVNVMIDGEIYCHEMMLNQIASCAKKNKAETAHLEFRAFDLIDCDVARTRLKGCGEDGASVCHAQLALLLRAVSALRPAEGYVQVACLVSALCVFLRVTVRQV